MSDSKTTIQAGGLNMTVNRASLIRAGIYTGSYAAATLVAWLLTVAINTPLLGAMTSSFNDVFKNNPDKGLSLNEGWAIFVTSTASVAAHAAIITCIVTMVILTVCYRVIAPRLVCVLTRMLGAAA